MNHTEFLNKLYNELMVHQKIYSGRWEDYEKKFHEHPEHFFDWDLSSAWATRIVLRDLNQVIGAIQDHFADQETSDAGMVARLVDWYVELVQRKIRTHFDRSTNTNRAVKFEAELEAATLVVKHLGACQEIMEYYPKELERYRRMVDREFHF